MNGAGQITQKPELKDLPVAKTGTRAKKVSNIGLGSKV